MSRRGSARRWPRRPRGDKILPEGRPRRIRLAPIADFSAATLEPFVAGVAAPGAHIVTDGWSGHAGLPAHRHDARVIGRMAAHVVLKWTHRMVSNLKRWGLGVYHGLRRQHPRRYLDEFVFRWNRRHCATRACGPRRSACAVFVGKTVHRTVFCSSSLREHQLSADTGRATPRGPQLHDGTIIRKRGLAPTFF